MVPNWTTSTPPTLRLRALLLVPHIAAAVYTTPVPVGQEPDKVPAELLSVNVVAPVTVTVQTPFTAMLPTGRGVEPAAVVQSSPAIATLGLPVRLWLVAVVTLIGLLLVFGIITLLTLMHVVIPVPHLKSLTLSGPESTWSATPALQVAPEISPAAGQGVEAGGAGTGALSNASTTFLSAATFRAWVWVASAK